MISRLKQIRQNQYGFGAMMVTVVILSVVLAVSLTAAEVIENGLQMGQTQMNSTKSFFAAEAGVERILDDIRNNGYDIKVECPDPTTGAGDYICFDSGAPDDINQAACRDDAGDCQSGETLYYDAFGNETRYYLNFYKVSSTTLSVTSRGQYREGKNERAIQTRYRCSDNCATEPGCRSVQPSNSSEVLGDAGYCCDSARDCYECDNAGGWYWDAGTQDCDCQLNCPTVCTSTPITGAHVTTAGGVECCLEELDCYECNTGMSWDPAAKECDPIN